MGNIFFERFADLCSGIGETPNSVGRVLGVSSGSITAWKNGAAPRSKTLSSIADYFGVSTDYLLGKETEKAPAETDRRNEISNRNIIRIAARNGSYQERTLTDEQLAALEAILNQMPDVADDI